MIIMNGYSSVSLGEINPDSESYDKSGQTILEELSLSSSEITEQDVIDYGKSIGIDPSTEPDLLWIAREGLLAPLPSPWIPVQDQLGRIYFHNKLTGISTWNHPVDRYLRSFVKKERAESLKGKLDPLKGSPMSGSTKGRLNPLVNLRFLDAADEDDDGEEEEHPGSAVSAQKVKEPDDLPLTNNQRKSIGDHSTKKGSEDDIQMGQSVIYGTVGSTRKTSMKAKDNESLPTEEKTDNNGLDQRLTLSSLADSEDEENEDSIEFELDENVFKEMAENEESLEEEVTLDVTEGGPCDVKNYHEIYSIDLSVDPEKNLTTQENGSKVKPVRPKSGKPGSRNIKPDLEVNDDLDNYIDVDGDEDDFSLQSIENDPFASEGVGMFQVPRPELMMSVASASQLETLKEEPDEDGKNDEDEDGFDEDEDASTNGEDKDPSPQKSAPSSLIDLIGQQVQFKKLSESLRKEIIKLRNELFTVINNKSIEMDKRVTERLDGVERRISDSEKSIYSIEVNLRSRNKLEPVGTERGPLLSSHGAECIVEVESIRKEIVSLSQKMDRIADECKTLTDKESSQTRKSLTDFENEFQVTMDQFRDFKKDNDLNIKAIRKQLTQVSMAQDNLESVTSKTSSDLHRLTREVNNIQPVDHCGEQCQQSHETLNRDIKLMMAKERLEREKLTKSIEEMKESLRSEIQLTGQTNRKQDVSIESMRGLVNDEMGQTKSVLHYLTKELETIKQSLAEKRNEAENSPRDKDVMASEERLIELENQLTVFNGKLEAIKVSQERERKMRLRTVHRCCNNGKGSKLRKWTSPGSSYEDSSLSSSSEELDRYREDKSRKDHHSHHHHSTHSHINHNQIRPTKSSSDLVNRKREIIKYSPLHFSPILIASQPSERSLQRVKSSSSSSVLAMIRRTSRLLQNEASDLDGLGNYCFVSDLTNGFMSRNALDPDEGTIRKLKQIRGDIDEKLKRLNAMVSSNSPEIH